MPGFLGKLAGVFSARREEAPPPATPPGTPSSPPEGARVPNPTREPFLSRVNNFGWAVGNAKSLANEIFNFPSMVQTVDVSVQGGPTGDMKRLHWLALSVAFGRLDLSNAGNLPFTIAAQWSITDKHVVIHLEYSLSMIAMAAAFSGNPQSTGVLGQVIGTFSTDLASGLAKLVGGPSNDAIGGRLPVWFTSALQSQKINPIDIPPANDGTRIGDGYQLPEQAKKILQMEKIGTPGGIAAVNPQPPVGDGVRSSLLEMVTAALSFPGEPLNTNLARPYNVYRPNLPDTAKGSKPDKNTVSLPANAVDPANRDTAFENDAKLAVPEPLPIPPQKPLPPPKPSPFGENENREFNR